MTTNPVSRRSFLGGLGLALAGLALELSWEGEAFAAPKELPGAWPAVPDGFRPNAFLHVAEDGQVTIVCHRSEMGQGVRSSLHLVIADELGADLARVKVVQGDGDKAYGDQNTDGSSSVRKRFTDLRRFGAAARTMLMEVAAARWKVPVTTLEAHDHKIIHGPSRRSFGFGELAAAASKLKPPDLKTVALRSRSELKHVGTRVPLLDGPDIVTGKSVFAADVKLPGLLTAVIARPAVVGGKVVKFDATAALKVPGVRAVHALEPATRPYHFKPLGGVAVLADNTWAALKGRAALQITWDDGDNAVYDSAAFRAELQLSISQPGKVFRDKGDIDGALKGAKTIIEADYHLPHLAHATMEPPCAVASFTGKQCEIWACTQNPQAVRKDAAKALGLSEDDVIVHVTMLGGAFGRKSKTDFVTEAALLSKLANAPVRVQWTREDDLQHDYYHSVSAQKLTAGLSPSGEVIAWRHRTSFTPIASTFTGTSQGGAGDLQQGVLDVPLMVPNVRAECGKAEAHTRIGWMRSVSNVFHAYAVQSFIAELAHARGQDHRDTLLELIGPARKVPLGELGVEKLPNYDQGLDEHPVDAGRLRDVITRVTEKAGWGRRDGRALGLAAHRSFLSYVAVVASVVRDASGRIRVDEVWITADAGTVVNLERVEAQLEGAVIFGMSLGLYGAITMKKGATEQSNFRDFRLVRMAEAPRKIHVEVVPSEGAPGGVGEPGVPPVAPAIANALFALTGQRVRELPLVKSVPV